MMLSFQHFPHHPNAESSEINNQTKHDTFYVKLTTVHQFDNSDTLWHAVAPNKNAFVCSI